MDFRRSVGLDGKLTSVHLRPGVSLIYINAANEAQWHRQSLGPSPTELTFLYPLAAVSGTVSCCLHSHSHSSDILSDLLLDLATKYAHNEANRLSHILNTFDLFP